MKTRMFLIALSLMLLPVLGCAGMLLSRAATPDSLTPEQIKAYNDVGLDLFKCFTLAGPPPTGSLTFFLWPKDRKFDPMFGPNCQIVQR